MKYVHFFLLSFIVAFVLIASFGANLTLAATINWTGNAGDNLASTAQNWSGNIAPVSGQDINLPVGSTVIWDMSGVVPASFTSSGNLTLKAPLITTVSLTVNSGKVSTNSFAINIGGDLILNGGELVADSSQINVSGNWKNTSGSVLLVAATVTFNGPSDKTILSGGDHFGNLNIASAGKISLSDDLFVDGRFIVSSGTLAASGKTIFTQGSIIVDGGTFSLEGGKLSLSGSIGRPLSVLSGMFVADLSSSVEYRPIAGSITVEPVTYGNLKLSGTGVFNLADNATVAGDFVVDTGIVFSPSGYALTVPNGNITNQGSIMDGVIKSPAGALKVLGADGLDVSTIKSSSGTIFIQIDDKNLNRKGITAETIPSAITLTTLSGDREIITVTETAPASGIFKSAGLIVHQDSAKAINGQIEVGQNDILFVKYVDPQDATDTKTIQLNSALSTLLSSGAPQIVSGPRIGSWSVVNTGSGKTYSAHIYWDTDRESTSSVNITSPQLTVPISAGNLTGTASHDVVVTGLIRGNSYTYTVSSVTADGKMVTSSPKKFVVIVPGDRIKTASSSAVYWYLNDKRNVFPDFTSYDSWFDNWNGIIAVPAEQLSDISLGKIVPIRAGTYLVKIQSDPKTYAVEPYGRLRWIQTEAKAIALYGTKWSTRVRDVDVSQFIAYASGDPITENDVPNGFVYQVGGGEWNAVISRTARVLPDSARKVNAFPERFVSKIVPSTVSSLQSAMQISGYEPELNGVFIDSGKNIDAPILGT